MRYGSSNGAATSRSTPTLAGGGVAGGCGRVDSSGGSSGGRGVDTSPGLPRLHECEPNTGPALAGNRVPHRNGHRSPDASGLSRATGRKRGSQHPPSASTTGCSVLGCHAPWDAHGSYAAYCRVMSIEDPSFGPLQIVIVGFETTERMRGEAARELLDLRGRGMIRVLDARFFHRAPDEELTRGRPRPGCRPTGRPTRHPIARLLGVNGAGGNAGLRPQEAFARTAGFALEDLRRLTDEIGPGDHAVVILIEHRWAGRLREAVREAGGRLVGQGFLTPELTPWWSALRSGRAPTPRRRSSSPRPHAGLGAGRCAFDPGTSPARISGGVGTGGGRSGACPSRGRVRARGRDARSRSMRSPPPGGIEAALLQAAVVEAEEMVSDGTGERPDADPD